MAMSTMSPAQRPVDGDSFVQRGVAAYAQALFVAGGKQLEALMRGGDGEAVCAALYMSPPYDLSVPALQVSRLSVNLTSAHVSGGIAGERRRNFDASRHSLFIAPAGAAMTWRKDAPSRHLTIYFRTDAFDNGDDVASPLALSQPLFNIGVPGIRAIADQLVGELNSPAIHHTEAADSLARLLLVNVARHLQRTPAPSQAIGPAALAQLRDFVMAHLTERILVADLARQVGLSPNRFAWAYKEQTGQSPHQFVLALRLEHACDLLRRSQLSLAGVAHACGFASQQHLTNAMHRRMGITPRRYRESRSSASVA
jgi:AraC family transcriptional regulator